MIGKILGNRYEIIEKIGGGGMALVYKAKCRLLNRFVAIKILRNEYTNDDSFIEKFKRESQSSASLSHPNIVSVYDVGCEDEIHYIVMEYVKGKTLKQIIREEGKLNPNISINYAIEIAEALNHAHKNNIIHRDIKPHNIMVTEEGRVKVMDFGIARAASTSTVTTTSSVIGSVHYFSPEQARGGYTDAKSDLYSLGIVMYEMITGSVPFHGDSPITVALKHIREEITPPSKINNSIPNNLEKIIIKLTKKEQSLRYKSAEELLIDLRKVKLNENDDIIEINNFNDSPTIVIPAVKDDNELDNKKKKRNKKNSKVNNKSNKSITIFAIILALVLTSSIAFGYYKIKDFFKSEEVVVPTIIGLKVEEAKLTVENLGLEFKVKGERFSSEFEEGVILSQKTKAGSVVKKGYPIEVYVSLGPEKVEVPKLINEYYTRADILLSDAGLLKGTIKEEYSEFPSNYVIKQNPLPGELVEKGTIVNYVISIGPEERYEYMPKITGINVEIAKNEIIKNGFKVGNVEYVNSDEFKKDIVIWQSYPYGQSIKEGTVVDIKVSNGKSDNIDNNENILQNNESDISTDTFNQNEISKALKIDLLSEKDVVELKIKKIQNNSEEVIYLKQHKTEEGSVIIPVKGRGLVKYIIYFDGNFVEEIEVNFN